MKNKEMGLTSRVLEQAADFNSFNCPTVDIRSILDEDVAKFVIRVRLFWVKMISGNHFFPNPHVWL